MLASVKASLQISASSFVLRGPSSDTQPLASARRCGTVRAGTVTLVPRCLAVRRAHCTSACIAAVAGF